MQPRSTPRTGVPSTSFPLSCEWLPPFAAIAAGERCRGRRDRARAPDRGLDRAGGRGSRSGAVASGPVVPLALVVAAVPTLVQPFGESEVLFARKLVWLRACHLLWFGALIAVLWLAIHFTWDDQVLGRQVIGNTALLVGLLLLSSGVTRELAWLPPMLLVAITYARGMNYDLGRPRRWALLLKPLDDTSVAISVGALVVGALIFAMAEGARPIRRRTAYT